ncbi:hypothetical protein BDQ17DRAFT_1367478 [Cyathus striatus]|nr:hypothetical protein BDQ17DRAFT_1367478 [Cyathus striatus]
MTSFAIGFMSCISIKTMVRSTLCLRCMFYIRYLFSSLIKIPLYFSARLTLCLFSLAGGGNSLGALLTMFHVRA